ncbi:MAG: hypothetical protein CMO55_02845 [Verrucomicrobiales bacterium]|nr:hypothetical protein [Verrucomicrobiales bacterium]
MNPPAVVPQSDKDAEHLKMLSTFHYVLGGLIGLFACIPLIHVTIGLIFVFTPESMEANGEMPPAFGWMFVAIGSFCVLMGWTFAILVITAGKKLARRQSRVFCTVIAGLLCMCAPFGTVLGVFTIIVLMRDSVRVLFDGPQQAVPGEIA